jgi:hypothetical protein
MKNGKVSTHWRSPLSGGNTHSIRFAAVAFIRRPVHDGQNVRRVSDDIQKRLYEIAEASLEMKFLYGTMEFRGLGLTSTKAVAADIGSLRAKLRASIVASPPIVVLLLLCSKAEAERYREAAEVFVDRVFFQEEIEECLRFLKSATTDAPTQERGLQGRFARQRASWARPIPDAWEPARTHPDQLARNA